MKVREYLLFNFENFVSAHGQETAQALVESMESIKGIQHGCNLSLKDRWIAVLKVDAEGCPEKINTVMHEQQQEQNAAELRLPDARPLLSDDYLSERDMHSLKTIIECIGPEKKISSKNCTSLLQAEFNVPNVQFIKRRDYDRAAKILVDLQNSSVH